jgi:hypothetical protein
VLVDVRGASAAAHEDIRAGTATDHERIILYFTKWIVAGMP